MEREEASGGGGSASGNLFNRDRLPRPTEELADAIGGGEAARPQTAAGNLIDGDRLPLPMEEREEAGGGTDSAASKLFTTAGQLV